MFLIDVIWYGILLVVFGLVFNQQSLTGSAMMVLRMGEAPPAPPKR